MAEKLAKKLADVMQAMNRIPKRGRNEFHKYDYATEADIAEAVRTELASRHIMLIPAIVGETRHPVGDKGSVLTVLEMEMQFMDGETGETITKPWRGYGTDKEDKGGYKAMTGGEKYFLLKTFLLPTGDDPEADEQQAAPKRSARPAAPKPEPPTGGAQAATPVPPAERNPNLISDAQRRRFFAIAKHAGWMDVEIKALLKQKYGLDSSSDIPWAKYEEICTFFEAGQ